MVIKFKDKFESILYAVLYSNLTGHFLSSRNEPENLFKEEVFIDIDKMNWQEIEDHHSQKFGPVKWLKNRNSDFIQLKTNTDHALRHWKEFKYKMIIESIRQALKFGLVYVNNKTSNESKELHCLSRQVRHDVHRALGFIRFIPVEKGAEKFLLAEFEEESQIGDLVLNGFKSRYFGYNLLLKTPKWVYLLYHDHIYQLSTAKFKIKITSDGFEKFWQVFYKANYIPERKNIKLATKLIPKKYWSWVKEGKIINQVDKGLI